MSVSGRVVDAGSGEAIPGAVVSLNVVRLVPDSRSSARRVPTDGAGNFVITSVGDGAYWLRASAPGYLTGALGQLHPGAFPAQVSVVGKPGKSGLVIRLWKLASLSGSVRDRDGHPLARRSVRVLRESVSRASRLFQLAQSVTTDDQGRFEATRLTAGRYVVAVSSPARADTSSTYFYPASFAFPRPHQSSSTLVQ